MGGEDGWMELRSSKKKSSNFKLHFVAFEATTSKTIGKRQQIDTAGRSDDYLTSTLKSTSDNNTTHKQKKKPKRWWFHRGFHSLRSGWSSAVSSATTVGVAAAVKPQSGNKQTAKRNKTQYFSFDAAQLASRGVQGYKSTARGFFFARGWCKSEYLSALRRANIFPLGLHNLNEGTLLSGRKVALGFNVVVHQMFDML